MKTVNYWLLEIDAAKKREKDYRKDGLRILEICEGEKKNQTPFNILFSNTETLLPALYSATPRPVVQRRFKDNDPVGMAAAKAGERVLSFLLDTNIDGYETFDEAMGAATYDALLPGRGLTRIEYDSEIGELAGEEKTPYKKSELVCTSTIVWNRVYFGYAKKWSNVPWVAYEFEVDKEEAKRLVGEVADKLKYSTPEKEEEEGKKPDEDQGEKRTTTIYQIWDKGSKTLVYVSPYFKEKVLKTDDDPLGLTGFFNCPRPLQFIERSGNLVPVAPYALYENQAKELNNLTTRINRITKAIKARGIYDGALGSDIETLMESDDNTLIPADKSATLVDGGMDKAIWFMPVEKLIVVLRELYAARESCKQVIFEIMGLADIMRGASQASETLGAQQIKQSWGGLKLKRKQKEVQRYARDILRMQLEVAAKKFSEDTWARMTGLPYLTEAKVAELTQIAQLAPAMQQLPPPTQQQVQQAQQTLQSTPQWSQVLEALKNDLQRAYRIDIETNSTVEPEAVEDQKNVADVMNALGQFLNGVAPLVQQGIMPFQAAQSMMLAVTRRFRFGDEIEEYIKQMKAPPAPPDPNQEAQQKAQQDAQKLQQEMQMKQEEHQMRMQEMQAELQVKAAELEIEKQRVQVEMQKLAMEQAASQQEHALKMEDVQSKAAVNRAVSESKMRVAESTAAAKEKEMAANAEMHAAKAKESTGSMEMLKTIVEALSADEEFDRDPQTQRIIRKRRVKKAA